MTAALRRAPLVLIACGGAQALATEVGRRIGTPVTPSHDEWFACGEAKHVLEENVRGCDVYVFQNPVVPGGGRSIYDHTMMLLHAVDAARMADADRVTAVIPYLPGARQDKRKGHVREGVTTGLIARMLEAAGVGMVVTVEPHNEAIYGCYDPASLNGDGGGHRHGGPVCALHRRPEAWPGRRGGVDRRRAAWRWRGPTPSTWAGRIAALSKERDYSQVEHRDRIRA